MNQQDLIVFEDHDVRRRYDAKNEKWYFSVTDIVGVLTDTADRSTAGIYWRTLKSRLKREGSEVVTSCVPMKMTAADGRQRKTDAADVETILRLVQSVPSKKAEPFKLWLAKVGRERLEEVNDPEKSLDRARANWQIQGRSPDWIQRRMSGQETRNKLTDYWGGHGIQGQKEYAILTNIIHREWSGISVRDHKVKKGLKPQNLRDHMSEAELLLTALAELSTRQIAESDQSEGFQENEQAARRGGGVAHHARQKLEDQTGRDVVTGDNFLPQPNNKRIKGDKS